MDIYGLKYTSGNITREGVVYLLNIYQRDFSGTALEIGDLQALSIEVQGASGGVDQPIVKTLLHFTMADTVDVGTVNGVKHGGWEEFYTPDATLYKVELRRNGLNIWGGFITPDSWGEPLVYNGSVSITARDNIGHIKDFEFSKDALLAEMAYLGGDSVARVRDDNLASVYELLFAAFNIAGVAMTLRTLWDEDDANAEPHLQAGSYDAQDWLVDLDALQEMDWYEVIEKVLVGSGLLLRYTDNYNISLMSMRSLHKMGSVTPYSFNANFVNRSGHRTLDPAYKQIVEKLNYVATDGYEAKWGPGDFVVMTLTIDGMVRYVSSLSLIAKWTQYNPDREVLRYADPNCRGMSDIAGNEDKYVLVAGRPTTAPTPAVGPSDAYAKRISYIDLSNYATSPGKRLSANTVVTVGFEVAHSYSGAGASTSFDFLASSLPCGAVRYAITWKKLDGTYLSLQDGAWVSGVSILEAVVPEGDGTLGNYGSLESLTVSETFQTPDEPGTLELRLYPFRVDFFSSNFVQDWLDAHVRVGNITFDVNTETVPRYFKARTVYDESQNYTLKRDVDFGAVPTRFSTAGTVRNGFYKPDAANGYPSIMNCHWAGDETELPLPVLNHLQILSLHAKANSVLGGELRDANGTPIHWNGNWHYAGRNFLLISGIWNILTGRVQDAVLREFDTYADAIGSISTDYDTELSGGDARIQALQKSINAAAAAAQAGGGGGGGGGGGTVTSVGVTVPSGMTVSGSPVTGSGTIAIGLESGNSIHGHSNKSTLDGINSTKVSHWDTAYGWGDHAQAGYLTSHQTIYKLTLSAGQFSAKTYTPNSAAQTVNIPTSLDHLSDGSSRKLSDYVTLATQQDITGAKTFKSNPVNIDSSSSLKVNGSSFIEIGDARIEYDSGSKALRVTKRSGTNQTIGFYADGFVSAKGVAASPSRDIVFIDGAQTISGLKTFAAALALLSTLDINGVTLTGSSSKLSVNKNTEFSGISNVSGGKISIQNLLDRIIALENIVNG